MLLRQKRHAAFGIVQSHIMIDQPDDSPVLEGNGLIKRPAVVLLRLFDAEQFKLNRPENHFAPDRFVYVFFMLTEK